MPAPPFLTFRKAIFFHSPAQTFYRAEEYHQQYLGKRGLANCHI